MLPPEWSKESFQSLHVIQVAVPMKGSRTPIAIADESFTTQNKLRLDKWEENPPKSPSILALFFYNDDSIAKGCNNT